MIFLFLLVFISKPVFCINKEVITLKRQFYMYIIINSWYWKWIYRKFMIYKVNWQWRETEFKWFKKILFDNGMPNEMRIPGYHNADMFFTIDRWMSEYIEMIGDLIGKNTPWFIPFESYGISFCPQMTWNVNCIFGILDSF